MQNWLHLFTGRPSQLVFVSPALVACVSGVHLLGWSAFVHRREPELNKAERSLQVGARSSLHTISSNSITTHIDSSPLGCNPPRGARPNIIVKHLRHHQTSSTPPPDRRQGGRPAPAKPTRQAQHAALNVNGGQDRRTNNENTHRGDASWRALVCCRLPRGGRRADAAVGPHGKALS